MYNDLADAVEGLKEQGYLNLSDDETFGKDIRKGKVPPEIRDTTIVETYRFDEGTDPGDESTLYVLERPDGSKGFLVLSFGMYRDPKKSALIDELHKMEKR
jgi:hypothetical protein